jgi:signal transduction histidine kinase
LDETGRVRGTNPYTRTVLGRDPEGLSFGEVVVDFSGTLDPHELARSPHEVRRLSVAGKDGAPQDLLCTFAPFGDGVMVLGGLDFEEQRKLATRVMELNRDLNNLTRDLQKTNAELERLDETKNRFLGMAAHDLRNPLGLAIGFTNLVLEEAEEELGEKEKEYLEKVLSWSRHMLGLVEDFLNVARIEAGRLDLDLEPKELPGVVERSLELMEVQAEKKGVELKREIDQGIPALKLDSDKMEQVVINLATNAVEFSHPGSAVAVRTKVAGDSVVLEVEDEGVGISEEDMERLFSPFHETKTKKTGGEKSTGLGLVISKKIVEAHGGGIEVESEEGRGSTFRVVLPLAKEEGEG